MARAYSCDCCGELMKKPSFATTSANIKGGTFYYTLFPVCNPSTSATNDIISSDICPDCLAQLTRNIRITTKE